MKSKSVFRGVTTYTVGSADNRHYDVTLNPGDYRHNDFSKTLAVHIDLYLRKYQIALIANFNTRKLDLLVRL